MEKISNIVRGNSRVASVDLKSSSAVRPGVPSFGRTVGESSGTPEREGTTASRAGVLQNQLSDQRRSSQDRVVEQIADQFFMSRMRRPEEETAAVHMGTRVSPNRLPHNVESEDGESPAVAAAAGAEEAEEVVQPNGYTPRGSYVDVRA